MAAQVGSKAPDFTLMDQNRNPVSLGDLAGHKALIVFIPFPFTGVCTGELCEIRDHLDELSQADGKVVVITCDTIFSNKAWATQEGFEFPILSDFWPHGAVTQAYGCFNDELGCAMRTTYVLDADGIVREIVATDQLSEARPFEAYPAALGKI